MNTLLLAALALGAPDSPTEVDAGDWTILPSGVRYADLEAGGGEALEEGDQVTCHYTLWLADGTKVDSSHDRGKPLSATVGVGQLIKGWDQGVIGMKPGGTRQLRVPSELGYGAKGAGPIPGDTDLIFEVEMLSVGGGRTPPEAPHSVSEYVTLDSGLKIGVIEEGTGEEVEKGDEVVVEYTGWVKDGDLFDSSYKRAVPLTFQVGVGRVIKGWDEGLVGMKVGGRRQLIIPPELGYGARGAPPRIPGNATLVFDVEVVDVR